MPGTAEGPVPLNQTVVTLAGHLAGHRGRPQWVAGRLAAYQRDRLRGLLARAAAGSAFHARRLAGIDPARFELADLARLPVLSKEQMMAGFDELATDRRLTRTRVEQHLAATAAEPRLLAGRYVCLASGGSSGMRGIFVQTIEEYAEFAARGCGQTTQKDQGADMLGFVTGASSGVGQAFAVRLAADGWDLHITARRGDRLEILARQLTERHGVRVHTHAADLTDPGDLAGLEEAIATAGPDLLVNNAGFAGYREFACVDPRVVSGLIGVHVTAVARLARAAVPAMLARGSGAIINVASLLAYSGPIPPQPLPPRLVPRRVKDGRLARCASAYRAYRACRACREDGAGRLIDRARWVRHRG